MGSETSVVAQIAPPAHPVRKSVGSSKRDVEPFKSTHPVGCALFSQPRFSRQHILLLRTQSSVRYPSSNDTPHQTGMWCYHCTVSAEPTGHHGVQHPPVPMHRDDNPRAAVGAVAARTSSSLAATRFAICFRDARSPPAAPATRAGMAQVVHPYPQRAGCTRPLRAAAARGYASLAIPQHVGSAACSDAQLAAKIGCLRPLTLLSPHPRNRSDARAVRQASPSGRPARLLLSRCSHAETVC